MKIDYKFPDNISAAILVQQNQPLVVDYIKMPSDLDYGQVLVKVHYSGICGSQLGEIDGAKGEDKYLPHLLGHEGSGVVIEIGKGVRYVTPDDHVVLHWRKGQGIDAAPPLYQWKGKPLNAGYVTTFNEYAIVSENRLTAISKDFDMKLATLFGCALTTGFGVISNNANLKIGESVIIFGAGGVGLSEIQAASMVSAYPIIAVDIYDNKLEMAKSFGASHLINSKQGANIEGKIVDIIGNEGADVAIDNTGNPNVIALAYKLTKSRGKTILVGVPQKGDEISIYSLPLHFGKILTGSYGGECNPVVDIPKYIRLDKAGLLKLEGLITDAFPLQDINIAIEKMRRGEIAGRCLVTLRE
jgi:S-(hydroxymethyl)glutathione dehydrogenase / alcohol dehydrogenase